MKLAVVRIRGSVGSSEKVKRTLKMLRLYRQNYCVLIDGTSSNIGMLRKIKDYITWGQVDDETIKLLFEKRGVLYKGREADSAGKISYKRKWQEYNKKKYIKYFRLNPPRGGFERKGTKWGFASHGALGDRKEKINALIKRMI